MCDVRSEEDERKFSPARRLRIRCRNYADKLASRVEAPMQIDVLRVFREIEYFTGVHARYGYRGKQPIILRHATHIHGIHMQIFRRHPLEHIDRRNVAWKQCASGPLG